MFFTGSDDKSVQITNIINNEAITNKLESENFVAIKIEANSVPHQQFSEICMTNLSIIYIQDNSFYSL